ncbi:MAG: phosphate ABC transporter substrate-binding protein PstS [Ferrovum sp.]|nr:phosphate ABC transporter substrate-binding protein PstS [Ferrovum sp.]NDU87328.1 phosphate ABC transporter substrate-binding protein PstS [Ferrovum sp.]
MNLSNSVRPLAILLGLVGVIVHVHAEDITGAGSTFVYPICAKWAEGYKNATQNGLNYQSIGSGGGIKQIKAKVVDFGATDKPLTKEELDKNGLAQWPIVMGGVVPVINVAGIKPGQLKLDGMVLADIYLGKIKRWNDGAIQALNKGLTLPAKDIVVVSRTDGSGTTFIFTNYLSKVSADWKSKVGSDTAVKWPTGINGKGNEGVASYVRQQEGSIGYVEYAYAMQNKMSFVALKNHDGQFVMPETKSFSAAASNAQWKAENGFYEILTDEPGKTSWPITGATFILMQKVQENPEHGKTALAFFDWAYKNGQSAALSLDYIPMPDSVVKLIEGQWKVELKASGGKALY